MVKRVRLELSPDFGGVRLNQGIATQNSPLFKKAGICGRGFEPPLPCWQSVMTNSRRESTLVCLKRYLYV